MNEKEHVIKFKKISTEKKNTRKRITDNQLNDDEKTIIKKIKPMIKSGLEDESFEDSSIPVLEGSGFGFSFSTSGTNHIGLDAQGSTKINIQDENQVKKIEETKDSEGNAIYKGQASYKNYIQQSKYHGPVKSATHIRADVVIDYAPDVCKDYKETGYCGYGDSCKFLHDRSDYKAGWQIEREWELSEKQRREKSSKIFYSHDSSLTSDNGPSEVLKTSTKESKDLPFACYICRKPFISPVVTRCVHYFCQDCALTRYQNDKTCAVCGESTLGLFNSAIKILKRRDDLLKQQTT